MKLAIVYIALIVGALFMAVRTEAEELNFDGNTLLHNCPDETQRNPSSIIGPAWCYGYLKGIAEMQMVIQETPRLIAYCVPEGVTMSQIKSIVLKYVQDHPEDLHYPSIGLVIVALNKAFPCPASGQ